MMMTETFERAKRRIDLADRILLLTDERSDGDTFGSSLAFAEYLRLQNKQVTHVAGSSVPEVLLFLPGIEQVTEDRTMIQDGSFDLVLVFDSSRESYVKELTALLKIPASLILFDHHASNTLFGEVNVVHPHLSSTCEVVFEYFRHHHIELSRDMAKCLMTGILTDTHVFSNPVTNSDALDRASELLIQGGSIKMVVDHLVKQMSVGQLQLWGRIFDRAVFVTAHKMAVYWVTQEDFDVTNTIEEDGAEVMDYLQSTLDVDLILFLKERIDGTVKVSMRSLQKDVSKIARFFGGGGHPGACGFSVTGRVQVIDDRVCIV